jgi:hypothetical protein
MRISDDRYELDSPKHDLAKRMILHNARTGTVSQWTGLSPYRVQQLARRYIPTRGRRRRGISPSQTGFFSRSPEIEAESLAFVYIAVEMQVIPEQMVPNARHSLPDLARGERLVEAYEYYRALVHVPHIPLERAVLLVYEYARRNVLLKCCARCNDLMLTERAPRYDRCAFCRDSVLSDTDSHFLPRRGSLSEAATGTGNPGGAASAHD